MYINCHRNSIILAFVIVFNANYTSYAFEFTEKYIVNHCRKIMDKISDASQISAYKYCKNDGVLKIIPMKNDCKSDIYLCSFYNKTSDTYSCYYKIRSFLRICNF